MTLQPGRARLATRPLPTGSPAAAKTMGMTDVACFAATTDEVSVGDNNVDLEPGKLGGDLVGTLAASIPPTKLDRDGATLDPPEFPQPLDQCVDPCALVY